MDAIVQYLKLTLISAVICAAILGAFWLRQC